MVVPKQILREWVVDALDANGGRATLIQVCKYIWRHHEDDLWESGDLFYTWQYDVRWAATDLRQRGILRAQHESPRGVWELATGRGDPPDPRPSEPDGEEVSSPTWGRDELILALDLYRRRGNLNASHREVIVLSETLRALPVNPVRPANYRSPASVNRKLGNFAALDPDFNGSGLVRASAMDGAIFDEFRGRPDELAAEARRIRASVGAAQPAGTA